MWFDVDKSGLAAILERRGKSFAVFELVQNAWDSGAQNVTIELQPIAGSPYATLIVDDDSPEGWPDLEHAYTMFARSRRADDPSKRGRFNLGEKLVLSVCRSASIATMGGTIHFDESGRRKSGWRTDRGTIFTAEIRMTRDELAQVEMDAVRLIPPVYTTFNGTLIERPKLIKKFSAKLPTEFAVDGELRRTIRQTTIEAYPGDSGDILELGVPVCEADWPWRLNVLQKVPLTMERDNVTDAFRRALQVAAVNALADTIDEETSASPWVSEAIGDARIMPSTLKGIVSKRFGDRAVVAVPGDPIANATAEANGYTVIHGGAFSGDAWNNVRKHGLLNSTSQAFPTPKPEAKDPDTCPTCGQKLKT